MTMELYDDVVPRTVGAFFLILFLLFPALLFVPCISFSFENLH